MRKRTVSRVVDPTRMPRPTGAQLAELAALRDMPDETIDTSDIPPLHDDFWARAVRNPFYRPTKQATTVRIDADVLAWLKADGEGYQTRLNTILRRAMLDALKS